MTDPATHTLWILVLSLIFAAASIVLSYMSKWTAVLAAYAALCAGCLSGYASESAAQLVFWAVASLMVVGICYLLPQNVRDSRVGVGYMATGSMAGTFIGMLVNSLAGVVTATALGMFFGVLAFSRLADGERLDFPSRKFLNYMCAKGLPLVVTFSMLGLLCMQLISPGTTDF